LLKYELLKVSKLATIIVGIGGIIAAVTIPSVMDLMIYTYHLWAPSIIPLPRQVIVPAGSPGGGSPHAVRQ